MSDVHASGIGVFNWNVGSSGFQAESGLQFAESGELRSAIGADDVAASEQSELLIVEHDGPTASAATGHRPAVRHRDRLKAGMHYLTRSGGSVPGEGEHVFGHALIAGGESDRPLA